MTRTAMKWFSMIVMIMGLSSAIQANANLIVNGGFESGNTGFTSDYVFSANLNPDTTYNIGSDPNAFHPAWASFGPQEGNNMMIINGAITTNDLVWEQVISGLSMNTLYYFSAYAASTYHTNPATLNFSINGSIIGASFTPGNVPGIWKQFYVSWNSGSNTSATIQILDTNRQYDGNDFALDNLSFSTIPPPDVPEPATMLIFGTGLACLAGLRIRRKK